MGKSRNTDKYGRWRKHSDNKPKKHKGNRQPPQEDDYHPGWPGQRGGMIVSGVCPT